MAEIQRARRDRVMTGDLPDDFLRFSAPGGTPVGQGPGMVPVMYPSTFLPVQQVPTGRLSITIVQGIVFHQADKQYFEQGNSAFSDWLCTWPHKIRVINRAKLAKNYGLTRMDPYCRITVGNHVFETPTAHNGAANPRWNKLMACPLPRGVMTIYVEIFDERSFSVDERIAWGLVQIKDEVFSGETLDDWYSLSGKQGEEKEGMINLVFAYREVPAQPMMYQQPVPVMMVPQPMVPGVPVMYPGGFQQQPQATPQAQPHLARQPSQQGIQNLKDMFPNMEESVIKSVLEASGNDVGEATTNLLAMTSEDQQAAT